ncbi:MAG: tRNA (N6-threonylcarbamoyladenosine(37)-N6)-methyltransferase TrmO [Anaerolineales bacterium]|jgi:tRNA-Thr(GGU) m(6)t(6)A37 methyltransferase TsaA
MADKDRQSITFTPIGVMHTPFHNREGMPIQPTGRSSAPGRAEIFPPFQAGLADLDGFSHIILIYYLHRVEGWKPRVIPFLDKVERGLFSTRAPTRPNPIGLSIVGLERVESGMLYLTHVDMLNQTPLLDIKPYLPEFDQPHGPIRIGWAAKAAGEVENRQSDDRFNS